MPLRVNYKNRIGYYTETRTVGNITEKYKMWFCHANAMCAIMYFYNEKNVQTGKTVGMAQLCGFFADNTHAKRVIKEGDFFRNCSNFHFRVKQMDARMWRFVKDLVASGIKVTLE